MIGLLRSKRQQRLAVSSTLTHDIIAPYIFESRYLVGWFDIRRIELTELVDIVENILQIDLECR